jgi:hypothetical protein
MKDPTFVHDEKTSGTRMELMVQDQKISYESDLYKGTVNLLRIES